MRTLCVSLAILLAACVGSPGEAPTAPVPTRAASSEPLVLRMERLRDDVVRPVPSVPVRPTVRVQPPHLVIVPKTAGNRPVATHSVAGLASWFCRAGVSICTRGYPPGSMVAAACGKLRAAIGPNWRDKVVTVRARFRFVVVKLVDFCASQTKTIDLYWEPMHRLGGTGVLPVVVSW